MNIELEKERIDKLESEKRLIILLSRLTFSNDTLREVNTILQDKNFNWFEFYSYALYHKVATLCWKNINDLCTDVSQPRYVKEMIHAAYLALIERNQLYQREIRKIIEILNQEKIKVIPVKGAYLIPKLYKDYGVRYSGDVDFLIKYDDLYRAEKCLEKQGYIKGHYDRRIQSIIGISRREDIKWKIFMSNGYPLLKLSNTELFPVYKIDFRFALDDSLDKQPVNDIIDEYKLEGEVKASHYLIHLCTHFYDEAKHSVDIVQEKDMNIIKLCDIREYIIQYVTDKDLEELVQFARKYALDKQVYFTMMYLLIIYNDGYERKILETLQVEDESFLFTFGDNTLKDAQIVNERIADRLFACGKLKSLISTPKLYL